MDLKAFELYSQEQDELLQDAIRNNPIPDFISFRILNLQELMIETLYIDIGEG